MPEHLRLKEDTDRANASRSQARGTQAFLSKYHHAGVFYSEDERTRELLERERKNAVMMEDQVQDVASLPKMMQVRDYGKRSRTKHTHLRDVDTTQQDAGWAKGGGSSSAGGNACFNCGQPGHVRIQHLPLFDTGLMMPAGQTRLPRAGSLVLSRPATAAR